MLGQLLEEGGCGSPCGHEDMETSENDTGDPHGGRGSVLKNN